MFCAVHLNACFVVSESACTVTCMHSGQAMCTLLTSALLASAACRAGVVTGSAGSAGGGTVYIFSQPFRLYRCVRVVNNLALQLVVSGLAVVRGVRMVQEARRRQKELEQVERQNAAAVVASPGPQAPPHFPAPTARPHSARSARFAEGAKLNHSCQLLWLQLLDGQLMAQALDNSPSALKQSQYNLMTIQAAYQPETVLQYSHVPLQHCVLPQQSAALL